MAPKLKPFHFRKEEERILGPEVLDIMQTGADLLFDYEQLLHEQSGLTQSEVLDFLVDTGFFEDLMLDEIGRKFVEQMEDAEDEAVKRRTDRYREELMRARASVSDLRPEERVQVLGDSSLHGGPIIKQRKLSKSEKKRVSRAKKEERRIRERHGAKGREAHRSQILLSLRQLQERLGKDHFLTNQFVQGLLTVAQVQAFLIGRRFFAARQGENSEPFAAEIHIANMLASLIDEAVMKFVNKDATPEEQGMVKVLFESLAATFFVSKNFQLQGESFDVDPAEADRIYKNLQLKMGGEFKLDQGVAFNYSGAIKSLQFSTIPDSVARVQCRVGFDVRGNEIPVHFFISRVSRELVAPQGWYGSYKPIFEDDGVGDAYEYTRLKVFQALDQVLEFECAEEDDYGEWWLEFQSDQDKFAAEKVEQLELEKTYEKSGNGKGVRGRIGGIDHRTALQGLKALGLDVQKGGKDFVVKGRHFETGEVCTGIFPGIHGAGRHSSCAAAAASRVLSKFGISREEFLRACS